MVVGTGSSAHDFVVPLSIMLRTSSDEHSSKWSSTAAAGGRTVVGSEFPVEFRTEATFSLNSQVAAALSVALNPFSYVYFCPAGY